MKELIEERVIAKSYSCPYCGHDFGVIDDAGYYFERTHGPECPNCDKEFKVVDTDRGEKPSGG